MALTADIISRGSASSAEDKSSIDKGPASSEKKLEGNYYDSLSEDLRSTKGSRRTSSLLNLFIPHQGMYWAMCFAIATYILVNY